MHPNLFIRNGDAIIYRSRETQTRKKYIGRQIKMRFTKKLRAGMELRTRIQTMKRSIESILNKCMQIGPLSDERLLISNLQSDSKFNMADPIQRLQK